MLPPGCRVLLRTLDVGVNVDGVITMLHDYTQVGAAATLAVLEAGWWGPQEWGCPLGGRPSAGAGMVCMPCAALLDRS